MQLIYTAKSLRNTALQWFCSMVSTICTLFGQTQLVTFYLERIRRSLLCESDFNN